MRESLSHYGRMVIIIIVLASLIGFIFGGTWLKRIGEVTDDIAADIVPINIEGRAAPVIYAEDQSATVGIPFRLTGLFTVLNADGEDISDLVNIVSKSNCVITETGEGSEREITFLAEEAGSYEVMIIAEDKIESDVVVSATKTITIVVNHSTDELTTMS